jgi:DNA polymerase-3 subunit beta
MLKMIFSCTTASLNKAAQAAMSAVPSKPSTPIFGGMHLIATKDTIELQGMDINLAISCTIKGEVEEEGEIVLAAARFAEMVKNMNGETVKITQSREEGNVRLQSGNTDYKILLMNAEEYPKFPEFNPAKTFTLPDEKIKELIKKTAFACGNETERPLYTGIWCDIKQGKITFVGTNSHRLAIKSMPLEGIDDLSIIIPNYLIKEINKNLNSKLPQEVKISLLNNQIMVVIDNLVMVSRLIDAKFPDYKMVIPGSFAVTTTVKSKDLAGAVSRMSLCSSDENDYSIVKLTVDQEELKVMSSSPDVGTGQEIVPCSTTGEKLNIAFNAVYLLDIMNNLEAEEAIIQFNNPLSPVCIKSAKDPDYIYIVTPVRVLF